MAVQQTTSLLAKKLGAQIAKAHQEHKDAPVDRGQIRLPPGIRNGTAQLNTAYISQYKEGDNKGKDFFRASGIVQLPVSHDGVATKGSITQVMIPLFDVPARGKAKAKSFSDQWYEFQNWFKQFGVEAPNESDPFKIEAYYLAAMKLLCDNKPCFTFSTRGWTPPAIAGQPAPKEMVFEEWHGMCDALPEPDPATNGVVDSSGLAPPPGDDAPDAGPPQTAGQRGAAPPPTEPPPQQHQPDDQSGEGLNLETAAVIADDDPTGQTPDGKAAIAFLTEGALAAGATDSQIKAATSWTEVAGMCVEVPLGQPDEQKPDPVRGTVIKYQLRGPDGSPRLGKDKQPLAAGDFEITSVDPATRTVTLKGVKTKLPIMGADKKPLPVSWDHLEV